MLKKILFKILPSIAAVIFILWYVITSGQAYLQKSSLRSFLQTSSTYSPEGIEALIKDVRRETCISLPEYKLSDNDAMNLVIAALKSDDPYIQKNITLLFRATNCSPYIHGAGVKKNIYLFLS